MEINSEKVDNTVDIESEDENKDFETEGGEVTELQDEPDNLSENAVESDNLSDKTDLEVLEEKYAALNDAHLRLMAEYDNFRKRTIREKADLIKSGGASVLTNILPVVDDFERALETMRKTEDLTSTIEGVKLIYDKFMAFLGQQGVKAIEAVGQPFDTELFEAIAIIPSPGKDDKGKVISCVQTGYTLYDKVLRHAKVVVGE
ncbi:MAG: nucleotide exchange factor GrpE [Tannerella sp.]|jgi:molecular chaperone GrpE|nr:nucleotide exchange factor GrpE [Tannerella sp.]